MDKEHQPREPQEICQKDTLVWSFRFSERSRFAGSILGQFAILLLDQGFCFELILLHLYQLYIMQKKSFLLPQPIVLPVYSPPQVVTLPIQDIIKITYYSDCMFKPYIHSIYLLSKLFSCRTLNLWREAPFQYDLC